MVKKNRQKYSRLKRKDPFEGFKRDHKGDVIKPCAYHGKGIVGVLNNVVIRDKNGPIPYSKLLKGGHYA